MHTFYREREKNNFKEFLYYYISIVILIIGVLFYIWPYIHILNINYEFERLLKEKMKLIQNNKVLKIELASLKSLDRVENIAITRLGLTFPEEGQMVYVFREPRKEN